MAAGVGGMTFDEDLAVDGFGDGQVDHLFEDDDDIFNAPAPLPPLSPSNFDAEANNVDGAEGQQNGESKDDKKKKKKVIKRSPQPRLDDLRLCSERGIPALAHLCDGIKFKGKGHEASDLKVLLKRFEHWAHRLYPKYPFNDFVEQIEAIGGKKLVQNTIKSVRRGDDGQANDNSDEEMLMNGEQESSDNAPSSTPSMNNANFGGQIEGSSTPVPQLGLTPEQQERIRLNREKALARRKQQQEALIASKSASQLQDNAATNSQEPSAQDSGNDSPERHALDFDTDLDIGDLEDVAKENGDETIETRMRQSETMETNVKEKDTELVDKEQGGEIEEVDETMENEMMQNETMETKITQDGTMETKITQDETMKTKITQDETMETKITHDETMKTKITQDETMETHMLQDETMETKITQNETMDTEKTQDETITTKPCEAEITTETAKEKQSIELEHTGVDTEERNSKLLEDVNLETKEMETMETETMET